MSIGSTVRGIGEFTQGIFVPFGAKMPHLLSVDHFRCRAITGHLHSSNWVERSLYVLYGDVRDLHGDDSSEWPFFTSLVKHSNDCSPYFFASRTW